MERKRYKMENGSILNYTEDEFNRLGLKGEVMETPDRQLHDPKPLEAVYSGVAATPTVEESSAAKEGGETASGDQSDDSDAEDKTQTDAKNKARRTKTKG